MRVLVVEDDQALADGVARGLRRKGLAVDVVGDGDEALFKSSVTSYDVVVLDRDLPGTHGDDVARALVAREDSPRIIMLTAHGDVSMAVKAIQAGAVDFLQKPCRDQALLDSINRALALDLGARQIGAGDGDLDQLLSLLTQREREVFDKLLMGGTSKQIARELDVSHRTIEAHRQNMLRKLGLSSVKELLALALASERER